MLKTNNKIVKERINKYIDECLDAYFTSSYDYELSEKERLAIILEWYYAQLATPDRGGCGFISYRYDESLAAFITNCAGLFDLYSDTQRGIVAAWLDETPTEAAAYDADRVEALYFNLLNRELSKRLDKLGLTIIYNDSILKSNSAAIPAWA